MNRVKPAGNGKSTRAGSPAWVFLFFSLLIAYPLVSFCWRNDYPLVSAEIGLLLGAGVVVGGLLTFIQTLPTKLVGPFTTALVVSAVFMVQLNLGWLALAVLAVLTWVFNAWLGVRIFAYALPVLLAMLLGSWFDSRLEEPGLHQASQSVPVEEDLPPIIHIIIDGFIGSAGLPDIPASAQFRASVAEFMQKHGFRVYPRAFTRHPNTGSSLYAAFNFNDGIDNTFFLEVLEGSEHLLGENRYFALLGQLGYRFNIYQTSHLDYCPAVADQLDRCWEYSHPNVRTILAVDSVPRRSGMIAKVLVLQSAILTRFSAPWLEDPAIAVHDPAVFDTLRADLAAGARGRVFFVHSLAAHSPFAFLHNCRIVYEDEPIRSIVTREHDRNLDPQIVEYRSLRYFEQAECALMELNRVFEQMTDSGLFDDSIIVLHGDHGSQISASYPDTRNLDVLTSEDYRPHYSTLYAVRFPGTEFSEEPAVRSLPELMSELTRSITRRLGEGSAEPSSDPAGAQGPGPSGAVTIYVPGSIPPRAVEAVLFPVDIPE